MLNRCSWNIFKKCFGLLKFTGPAGMKLNAVYLSKTKQSPRTLQRKVQSVADHSFSAHPFLVFGHLKAFSVADFLPTINNCHSWKWPLNTLNGLVKNYRFITTSSYRYHLLFSQMARKPAKMEVLARRDEALLIGRFDQVTSLANVTFSYDRAGLGV